MSTPQPPMPPATGPQPWQGPQSDPAAPAYPQAPGYPPPTKKRHTVRNVLLILGIVFILFVGGCMALIGTAANEADKALEEEAKNDKPSTIVEGGAFTHDDFELAEGWRVDRDLGSATIKGLSVTNLLDEPRTAMFTFRFYKGNENLGEVECSSNELQSGESSRMDCFSLDNFPKGYTEIKVSDMW